MSKQLPAIILVFVCAALAVSLVTTKQANARLSERLAQLETEGAAPSPPPEDTALLNKQAEEAITIAASDPEAASSDVNPDTVEQTLKDHQRVMSSIANMRENPTMNKMIEASQRGTIGALYADMIDYLDLDADETKYFMDLLMYRQMAQVDFGMNLMSGTMTDEQRQAAVASLGEIDEEMKAKMEEFLNSEDDYEEFRFYEKTIGERMALSQMDQALAGSGQSLSDDGYRDLLDMMATQKDDYDWATDLHDQESPDISAERFSEENVDKHVADLHQLNELIFDIAQGMLTPEQFEAFKSSIAATTDMQLAQFQMAAQLLRGQQ